MLQRLVHVREPIVMSLGGPRLLILAFLDSSFLRHVVWQRRRAVPLKLTASGG